MMGDGLMGGGGPASGSGGREASGDAGPDRGGVTNVRTLRLNSVAEGVTTLGPAPATVLWCQGCSSHPCRDCMSPQTWDPRGGVAAQVADVACWLAARHSRFLTVSGGEPFEQAEALGALLDLLDEAWIVTVYSGFDLTQLRADGLPGVAELLDRIDVLIAGPYVRERHASRLWRGSDNQVIHDFTGRAPIPEHDLSAGITVRATLDGFDAIGVPPTAGFLRVLHNQAHRRGITLRATPVRQSFPFPVEEL